MLDTRPILLAHGVLLSLLAAVMLLPMLLDLAVGNEDWKVFAASFFITGFSGGILFLTNRGYRGTLNIRQAFIFTTSTYVLLIIFAALPLYLSSDAIDVTDAFFESASGLTTTGSTVLSGLDAMPPGILLWRSLLNMMGGIGIVVLALAVLPMLRIGGMQLFRTESSDTNEKSLPRTTQIASAIAMVFLVLTAICALCYRMAGMSGFDAINHAMSTVATGGFSTHDASFAFFDNPLIEWIAVIFMMSGAVPLILYFQMVKGKPLVILRNTQVQWLIVLIAASVAMMVIWLVMMQDMRAMLALRQVTFNIVSVVTTTGFASTDYMQWGIFPVVLFFMLTVVGGCTGSTSGGIKIFRLQILYYTTTAQIKRLIQPHGVFVPRYNGKPISEEVAASVMTFIVLFGISFTVIAMVLSLYGLDFLTCMSAAAQALANVGPGLGDVIGPAGNYATFPDGAKWLLSFAMIMGRLELFTVLVLLAPSFWRD